MHFWLSPTPTFWRCMACGPRQIETTSDTARYLLSAEGPLPFAPSWDYRVGTSVATSDSKSKLGSGYHYWQKFADLINNGVLNPFLLAGETQSVAAMSGLEAASARGVSLYGGKYTMTQTDAVVSGPVMIQVLEGTITRDAARAPPVDHVGGGEPLNLCRHVRMLLCPTLPISLHPPECMILGLLSVPGAQVGSASGNVGARLV